MILSALGRDQAVREERPRRPHEAEDQKGGGQRRIRPADGEKERDSAVKNKIRDDVANRPEIARPFCGIPRHGPVQPVHQAGRRDKEKRRAVGLEPQTSKRAQTEDKAGKRQVIRANPAFHGGPGHRRQRRGDQGADI